MRSLMIAGVLGLVLALAAPNASAQSYPPNTTYVQNNYYQYNNYNSGYYAPPATVYYPSTSYVYYPPSTCYCPPTYYVAPTCYRTYYAPTYYAPSYYYPTSSFYYRSGSGGSSWGFGISY